MCEDLAKSDIITSSADLLRYQHDPPQTPQKLFDISSFRLSQNFNHSVPVTDLVNPNLCLPPMQITKANFLGYICNKIFFKLPSQRASEDCVTFLKSTNSHGGFSNAPVALENIGPLFVFTTGFIPNNKLILSFLKYTFESHEGTQEIVAAGQDVAVKVRAVLWYGVRRRKANDLDYKGHFRLGKNVRFKGTKEVVKKTL